VVGFYSRSRWQDEIFMFLSVIYICRAVVSSLARALTTANNIWDSGPIQAPPHHHYTMLEGLANEAFGSCSRIISGPIVAIFLATACFELKIEG